MRYKMVLQYDGGDFNGFQRQRSHPSVQQAVEEAISLKLQRPVTIVAAGRTDAGVHALGQVIHFDSDGPLPADFHYRINSLLPDSIAALSCEPAPDNFSARFSAVRKTYRYDICLSKIHVPLLRRYCHICVYDLDIDSMRKACAYLIGEHDFRSFALSDSVKDKNTVRAVYDAHIEERDNNIISFYITGNGFLHNMVRSVAGTLIDIGRGRFSYLDMPNIIAAADRRRAGKTVSGCGLYLVSVEY